MKPSNGNSDFQAKILALKKELHFAIHPYKGIPTTLEFVPYNHVYYGSLKRWTPTLFGDSASIRDVIQTMYFHGNVIFFKWFPDLYETNRDRLGIFFNPIFKPVNNNKFADYLHNLTHIRSLSSHTNLGEALAVIDNLIFNKVSFQTYMNSHSDKELEELAVSPDDLKQASEVDTLLSKEKQQLFEMIKHTWGFQRTEMTFYQNTYKEGQFKKEFPTEQPKLTFLSVPANEFEERMKHNLIRAIVLDEKFKFYSDPKTYFSETPVKLSSMQSYELIFTNDEENKLIELLNRQFPWDKLHDELLAQIKVDSKFLEAIISRLEKFIAVL